MEMNTLRTDNIKLYEKLQYVKNYKTAKVEVRSCLLFGQIRSFRVFVRSLCLCAAGVCTTLLNCVTIDGLD